MVSARISYSLQQETKISGSTTYGSGNIPVSHRGQVRECMGREDQILDAVDRASGASKRSLPREAIPVRLSLQTKIATRIAFDASQCDISLTSESFLKPIALSNVPAEWRRLIQCSGRTRSRTTSTLNKIILTRPSIWKNLKYGCSRLVRFSI